VHDAVSVMLLPTTGAFVSGWRAIWQTGTLPDDGGGGVLPPHSTVMPTLGLVPALFTARRA
jgi:hypothetical protein